MTTTRYLIARVAQAFGYVRKAHRMGDAAREMHLLREAEAYLGLSIWENCKDIENLSVEYWNLRKLQKEHDVLQEKINTAESGLASAHEERAHILEITPETNQELIDQRAEKLKELEALATKRDLVVAQGRDVRRIYVGLKMKLEVLTQEASHPEEHQDEIQSVKQRLEELKNEFTDLKNKRIKVGQEIEQGDAELDAIDEQLKNIKQDRRLKASDSFQVIGDCNKQLSVLHSEIGSLETQMRSLHGEIGRYVSRYYHNDPQCAAASKSHRTLAEVMRALRRSIALNLRLSGSE
jgi:predicted  nucleic acid-binding Zn-ribbon protein